MEEPAATVPAQVCKRKFALFSVLMFLALVAVILLSLAFGVGMGYVIIFGILHLFDRSRQMVHPAPAPALHTSASGD